MDKIEQAFKRLFGDMYLSESETALRIFEYGYKAGVAAENEACAKVADDIANKMYEEGEGSTGYIGYVEDCAAAIRERMK